MRSKTTNTTEFKKILLISGGDINNPNGGYLIRVNNLYKCIHSLNREVKVLQYPIWSNVKKVDKNVISLKSSRNYFLLGLKIIYDSVRYINLIRKYDIIMIEGSLFLPYAILGKLLGKIVVYDSHGFLGMVAKDLKGVGNLIKRKIIGEILDYISLKVSKWTIVVSNVDKEFAIKKYGIDQNKFILLPIVIDIEENNKNYELNSKSSIGDFWIYVGDLLSIHNYLTVLNIIEIAKKLPDENFLIIGRGKERFNSYPSNVKFIGFVENIGEYYDKAKGCLIPMFVGMGVKTKVLECLKFGKPVITTIKGSEGLENLDEIQLCGFIVVNTLDEMIDTVKKFDWKQVNSDCLKEYVRKYYSVGVMCKLLQQFLDNI